MKQYESTDEVFSFTVNNRILSFFVMRWRPSKTTPLTKFSGVESRRPSEA